jgi:hypothetical protein
MGGVCGTGGGGAGGGGLGGCGGELIGVAQEADTQCCCPSALPGTPVSCTKYGGDCPPYTTNSPGACPDTGTGITCLCSASGVGSAAGGANAAEMFVLFLALALAAFRAMRRRFA